MRGSVIMYIFSQGCLIFFSGVWSQAVQNVTYPSEHICANNGSSVFLQCSYHSQSYHTRYWYRKRDLNGIPKNLRDEPDYRDRILVSCFQNTCNLNIRRLRASDCGVYYCGFKTWTSSYGQTAAWFLGSPGITLTVSGAQLKVDPTSITQRTIKITCATSCILGPNVNYRWYRNSKYVMHTKKAFTNIDLSRGSEIEGSYQCEVTDGGYELKSSAVCVLGSECWGVSYPTGSICGLKGSSVVLSCSYKYPGGHQFEQGRWYRVNSTSGEPEDLSLNPVFRDRVEISASNCSLAIRNLKENDAGVYMYTFKTVASQWITAKTGVLLSVTELQVTVNPHTLTQNWIKVSCSTSCRGSSHLYYWYRNGQLMKREHGQDIHLYYTHEGHYSCSMQGYEKELSPAVCINGEECWGVTYSTEAICALAGSSVDITCHYKHPAGHTPTSQSWFHHDQQPNTEHRDLSHDDEGRVEYRGNNSVHTLRLSNLTEADAGEYFFHFETNEGKMFDKRTGVALSVTSLQVTVSSAVVTEGDSVILSCSSTCPFSNNPTFTWYKNSRPVRQEYKEHLHLTQVNRSDSGLYTCSVKGQESYSSTAEVLSVRYPPRKTIVSEIPSDEPEKGHVIVLSCNSQANPSPHTYSWYKRHGLESVLIKVDKEVNLTVTSGDEGLYHCEAHNEVGSQNSSVIEVHFTGGLGRKGFIILAAIVLFGLLLSLFWWRNRRSSEDNKSTESKPQADSAPVYGNISAMAMPADPANTETGDDVDIEYASIQFSGSEEQEKHRYSAVLMHRNSMNAARRADDSSVVYSAASSLRLSP